MVAFNCPLVSPLLNLESHLLDQGYSGQGEKELMFAFFVFLLVTLFFFFLGFCTLVWPVIQLAIFIFPTWKTPGLFCPWKFFKVS